MSSTFLSVLLLCDRGILRHRGKFSNMLCSFNLIGSHVRHFSDRNQTVCPTLKKLIMASHYAKTTWTLPAYLCTVASNKFWSSMSFQNLVSHKWKKFPCLIMPMSIKCQKIAYIVASQIMPCINVRSFSGIKQNRANKQTKTL
jgi:hypothetical protein